MAGVYFRSCAFQPTFQKHGGVTCGGVQIHVLERNSFEPWFAGIAMGLMLSADFAQDKKYKVLTDIQGPEDEFGDMDFKVAGTREGVTAIQMDIKLDGVAVPILVEALTAARAARLQILDVIEKEIAAPRASISPRAPEILTMRVKPDQIGMVIGGGGKTINGIREVTGVEDITIEDDGSVFITGKGGTALHGWLAARGVTAVDVAGIATDHCVRATALDAARAGFTTTVLLGLCAGVAPETTDRALAEMAAAGVTLTPGA